PGPRRHSIDFWHSYGCCDRHLEPHYWEGNAKINERIDVKQWSVEHETDVAVDYIHNTNGKYRDPEKPFALFVAHNPPHMPFDQVPEKYLKYYDDKTPDDLLVRPNIAKEGLGAGAWENVKNYFAAITGIDEQFGRILHALEDGGLTENTIVVFTSDHGEMMGSQGSMYKVVWYDESLLIPFIIRWPRKIHPGQDDLLLGVPDIMPTLLRLMGIDESLPDVVEGKEYSGAFLDEVVERPKSAFYLVPNLENPLHGNRGLRTHDYTFVIQRDEGGENEFLYNNAEDPFQMKNAVGAEPEVVEQLHEELHQWLIKTNDPWVEIKE
ncbi:MAG: sulfatase-like hydrolase/transferase, partial [Anaerolineaceae bacterium]|nr:sulfatase-like hydrolase/transferase [Anaerolineaceae bacterium]